ncbi:hypothetical protein [Streptomyces xanthophaeus]
MSAAADAQRAGRQVEEILDRLAATGDRPACEAAEELVRVLMEFYGAGLARVVERIGADALAPLLDDELVASLLALHDLNPEDVHTRIARALDAAADPLELLGFDERTGVLRVRPGAATGGCGCSATADDAQQSVEDALACFAPEVTRVELAPAPAPEPALLQISTRPHTPAQVR